MSIVTLKNRPVQMRFDTSHMFSKDVPWKTRINNGTALCVNNRYIDVDPDGYYVNITMQDVSASEKYMPLVTIGLPLKEADKVLALFQEAMDVVKSFIAEQNSVVGQYAAAKGLSAEKGSEAV